MDISEELHGTNEWDPTYQLLNLQYQPTVQISLLPPQFTLSLDSNVHLSVTATLDVVSKDAILDTSDWVWNVDVSSWFRPDVPVAHRVLENKGTSVWRSITLYLRGFIAEALEGKRVVLRFSARVRGDMVEGTKFAINCAIVAAAWELQVRPLA